MLTMKRCLKCMKEYDENSGVCPYCGWDGQDAPEDAMAVRHVLGERYVVGAVRYRTDRDFLYSGWDLLFDRRVMILEYFPRAMASRREDGAVETGEAEREDFLKGLDRFLRDSRRLITLDDTPGLLNVLAVTEDGGTAYAILDHPEGMFLGELMGEDEICPPEQVQWMVQEISRPVAAAHGAGICHGQIDADHVFVVPDGSCLLAGFHGHMGQESDIKLPEKERTYKDVADLASLAGSILTGRRRWMQSQVSENLERMRGDVDVPECIFEALWAALGTEEARRPASVRRFADLFLDEATIQLVQA